MNTKSHIPIIPAILKERGVETVVISPGSRNAPLTQVFYRDFNEGCLSIVDERSAAYYALGIALKTRKPVVLITTSGTAVLNLAPAIAEAYHQGVALIAITADRPKEWLNQQDNQTINQQNVLANNCKASFELPLQSNVEDDLWYVNRLVNEAYNTSLKGKPGPVHINVPLREPLYENLPQVEPPRIIEYVHPTFSALDESSKAVWNKAKKILLVVGQLPSNETLCKSINKVVADTRVAVVAESISNVTGDKVLVNSDYLFTEAANMEAPDLLIYMGGQVVSKRLKQYLRALNNTTFWYVSPDGGHVDTFQHLHKIIVADPFQFIEVLQKQSVQEGDFQVNCLEKYDRIKQQISENASNVEFSDLFVFESIAGLLEQDDVVFVGNSSVVRYFQLFTPKVKEVYSNRGTSGIDGCVSTSAGIAAMSEAKVVAVTGDLSFVYDSNGLWNKNLPDNLKIIVVNNGGGGIFSMIDGPSKQEAFTEFFEAYHPVSIEKIASAFGVAHFFCDNANDLNEKYKKFYASPGAALLEIKTNSEVNTSVFRNFVENILSNE